jgi:hypothetical protein
MKGRNKTKSRGKRTEKQKDCNEWESAKKELNQSRQQRERIENCTGRKRTINQSEDATGGNI